MGYKRISRPKEQIEYNDPMYRQLQKLEDAIENGTLIFREKPKRKYYAIVGYRNYCGQFGWHIEHTFIEYEKKHNQVAVSVNGVLFVTNKDWLFDTKAEAEAKLRELQGTER